MSETEAAAVALLHLCVLCAGGLSGVLGVRRRAVTMLSELSAGLSAGKAPWGRQCAQLHSLFPQLYSILLFGLLTLHHVSYSRLSIQQQPLRPSLCEAT